MAGRVHGARFSAIVVRWRTALCALGLLAVLAACSSSAPGQAKPVANGSGVPAGYTEFSDPARGYSLAVPSSWVQVNVQAPGAAAQFSRLLQKDAQLSKLIGNNLSSLLKDNVSLVAVGSGGSSANMVVDKGSGTLSASQLATVFSTELEPGYEEAGITILSHQQVSLDSYPALRISVTVNAGTSALDETQFIAAVHNNEYVLTISHASASVTSEIAGSVRF